VFQEVVRDVVQPDSLFFENALGGVVGGLNETANLFVDGFGNSVAIISLLRDFSAQEHHFFALAKCPRS